MTRKLSVLNINDEILAGGLAKAKVSDYCDLTRVASVHDAVELLQEQQSRSFDVFLIDVNMERAKRGHPQGLQWGDPSIRPYGPLLALPFLEWGQMPKAFVPYSTYWARDSVKNNGYVVVALSLFMSESLGNAHQFLKQERGHSDPETALNKAVGSLRERISSGVGIRLLDIASIRSALASIQNDLPQGLKHGDAIANRPILDRLRHLAVTIYTTRPHWTEASIQLQSLFLDVLALGKNLTPDALCKIAKVLESWQERSDDALPYNEACDYLIAIAESSATQRPNVVAKFHANASPTARKYAILFAWIETFGDAYGGGKYLDSVQQKLGLQRRADYDDWCGKAWCDKAKLPAMNIDTTDARLVSTDFAFCLRYSATCTPGSATSDVRSLPPWLFDPGTSRGARSWERLQELGQLFGAGDAGCVCHFDGPYKRIGVRDFAYAHDRSCGLRAEPAHKEKIEKEEHRRLAHLLFLPFGGDDNRDWNAAVEAKTKRDAFNDFCCTKDSSAFDVVKTAVHQARSTLHEPSLAAIVTMLWMHPGMLRITLQPKLSIDKRFPGLPDHWQMSLGGIAALATDRKRRGEGQIEIAFQSDALTFTIDNRLDGHYRAIRQKIADRQQSNRCQHIRWVYGDQDLADASADTVGSISITEPESGAGLAVSWHLGAKRGPWRDNGRVVRGQPRRFV